MLRKHRLALVQKALRPAFFFLQSNPFTSVRVKSKKPEVVPNTELSCVGLLSKGRSCDLVGLPGVGKACQAARFKTTSASTTC